MFELGSRIDLGNDESPTEGGSIGLENGRIRRIVMSEGWSRGKAVVLGFRRRVVERGIFSLSPIHTPTHSPSWLLSQLYHTTPGR